MSVHSAHRLGTIDSTPSLRYTPLTLHTPASKRPERPRVALCFSAIWGLFSFIAAVSRSFSGVQSSEISAT